MFLPLPLPLSPSHLSPSLLSFFPSLISSSHFLVSFPQISLNCWNTTEEVTNYLKEKGRGQEADDLFDLWGEFQRRARELVELASPDVTYGVVRSSALTDGERRQRFLDPERYVIQVCRDVWGMCLYV